MRKGLDASYTFTARRGDDILTETYASPSVFDLAFEPASEHVPTPIMAEYYGQRGGAGLIITEGTAPDANGVGYPRIPGVYNDAQVEGWKQVTAAVHENGAKIAVQLMHTASMTSNRGTRWNKTTVGLPKSSLS